MVRGVGSDGAEARRRSFWLTTFSRDIRSYNINAGVNAVCGVRSGLNYRFDLPFEGLRRITPKLQVSRRGCMRGLNARHENILLVKLPNLQNCTVLTSKFPPDRARVRVRIESESGTCLHPNPSWSPYQGHGP